MDVLKEFEEYLPRWSEEKHQPIPTKQHIDRWYIAWQDFLDEVLTPRYAEMQNSYNQMKYKEEEIESSSVQIEDVKQAEILPEIQTAKSNWELVQEKRRKNIKGT